MTDRKSISRRNVLKGVTAAAGAAVLPSVVPSTALGADGGVAPSNRITMGFIGTGGHGIGMNLRSFLRYGDAQAVALCDVDAGHLARAMKVVKGKYGQAHTGCTTTKDWREVIARKDIDGVMISTPDHWHVPMSVAAARAGKDVICEKPTLTVNEGRVLADTIRRHGRVFQLSTEDRSVAVYHRMAELVRNGRIGKLRTIRVKLPAGNPTHGQWSRHPTRPVPKGLDYDLWLGPAPVAPYTPGRCHWNFRWISDYSGGQLTDWGAHLIDTAQWGNDTERTGPVTIAGAGVFPADGLYDTAVGYHIEYTYANGVTMIVDSGGVDLKFEGTDGWVGNRGWRGRLEASSPKILNSVIGPEELHLFTCPAGEHRNFLDCVKSRQDPYFPAEVGHRCCTVMHLGNIAMLTGRKLRWNPDTERFAGDEHANTLLTRAMRQPWHL